MSQPLKVQLHKEQKRFRESKAAYRGFVGGRGSGKSFVGALDMLVRSSTKPGTYLAVAPTYPMLRDGSLQTFQELGKRLTLLQSFHKGEMVATLTNGSKVLFRSADEPDRLRGPNLSGAWLDEASLMDREAFNVVIACLREGGQQGWLSATFTPRGRGHWTYETFGTSKPDTELFTSKTSDNPFLPSSFTARLMQQYTSAQAMQELEGAFIDVEGALFRRHWFQIVDVAPAGLMRVRAWDLAATAPKAGSDPDYTVGVRMGRDTAGTFYLENVVRVRETPQAVEKLIVQTAKLDGPGVFICMEQEPGSSGVALADHYLKLVAGYVFRAVRSTGDKMTRALPLAAQAEGNNIKLVRGNWNDAFLDEVETFPFGRHDDQVDAAAGAFAELLLHPEVNPDLWGPAKTPRDPFGGASFAGLGPSPFPAGSPWSPGAGNDWDDEIDEQGRRIPSPSELYGDAGW
jgi:predicted phage terminase large subunit-like protein